MSTLMTVTEAIQRKRWAEKQETARLNRAAIDLALYHLRCAEMWESGRIRNAHLKHSLVTIAYAGDREQKRQAVNLMGRV